MTPSVTRSYWFINAGPRKPECTTSRPGFSRLGCDLSELPLRIEHEQRAAFRRTRGVRTAGGVMEKRSRTVDRAAVLEVAADDEDLLGAGDMVVEARPLAAGGEVDLESALHAVLPEVANADLAEHADGGVAGMSRFRAAGFGRLPDSQAEGL